MAIAATTVWEIRTTGSTNNGGGFNNARGGVDYSQQDSAQLTVSDAACAGDTALTSATGGFTAGMVGNIVNIATVGRFEIVAVVGDNEATLDATPGTFTGKNAYVGGACALLSDLFPYPGSPQTPVSGNTIWVKASGEYEDRFNIWSDAAWQTPTIIEGYGTTRGDGTQALFTVPNGSSGGEFCDNAHNYYIFKNLKFDATLHGGAALYGWNMVGNHNVMENCWAANCESVGFYGSSGSQKYIHCIASGCGWAEPPYNQNCYEAGFYEAHIGSDYYDCHAYDTKGHGFYFQEEATMHRCFSYNNGGAGIFLLGVPQFLAVNCTIHNNGYNGLTAYIAGSGQSIRMINCLFTDNTGYGAASLSDDLSLRSDLFRNCGWFGNTIDKVSQFSTGTDEVTLVSDPYVNKASLDFTPTGAALNAGYPSTFPSIISTNALDIGAIEAACAVCEECADCPEEAAGECVDCGDIVYGDYAFPNTFHPANDDLQALVPITKSLRRHGAHSLEACLREKRLLVRGGLIKGPMDRSDLRPRIDSLREALGQQPQNLSFDCDRYWRNVRVEEFRNPYGPTHFCRIADGIEVLFVTDDPFQYSTTSNSDTWANPADGATHALTVGGNAPAQPKFRVVVGTTGNNSTYYRIANNTTNEALVLSGGLAQNDVIEVDTLTQEVTVNNTDSMAIFDGQFIHFETGSNTLEVGIENSSMASLTTSWRNRWW